jgi:hypothetical protein
MLVRTDLRTHPTEAARNISYSPTAPLTALDVQSAIEQVQAEVATGSVTPPAIVPTSINFAMSPYAILGTDYLIEVDTSGGQVQLQTAASATRNNLPFTVKDVTGNGQANPIAVLASGAETIDGLASYPLASDFAALTFKPKKAGGGYEVPA